MNKTLRQEIQSFVEDMKAQEAGLIKRAGEAIMDMPAEEIFNKPKNFSTNIPEVTERQIFLHRLQSKLAIIQEYRSQLENILSYYPEPQPQTFKFTVENSQQKQARICADCKTEFICNGECQDNDKIRFNDNCICPKCAKKMPENIVEKFKCETRFPTNGSRNLIKKIAQKYAQTPINKVTIVAKKADFEPKTPQPKQNLIANVLARKPKTQKNKFAVDKKYQMKA